MASDETPKLADFVPYLDANTIQGAIQDLAKRISEDYSGKTLVLVSVLKGAYFFTADLMRALKMDVELDFVRLSSYGKSKTSSGTVTLLKDISRDLRGKHVLILDEIIDSGRSLAFLRDRLLQTNPASLEIAALVDKPSKREVHVPVKYIGLTSEPHFLIGYGLDLDQRARNLNSILRLSPKV